MSYERGQRFSAIAEANRRQAHMCRVYGGKINAAKNESFKLLGMAGLVVLLWPAHGLWFWLVGIISVMFFATAVFMFCLGLKLRNEWRRMAAGHIVRAELLEKMAKQEKERF